MRLKEKNLYSAPKRPARTRLYGSIQGTAQIGSLEKSYKLRNYTAYIQKKKNENEILCVHYGRWHAHDLTSEQVLGRATSNFVWKRLVRVQKKSLDFGFFCDVNQNQAPVVQKLDNAIHQINRYPKDEYYEN